MEKMTKKAYFELSGYLYIIAYNNCITSQSTSTAPSLSCAYIVINRATNFTKFLSKEVQ